MLACGVLFAALIHVAAFAHAEGVVLPCDVLAVGRNVVADPTFVFSPLLADFLSIISVKIGVLLSTTLIC